jgi:CRP/FNR family transcriptional regulator, cyclic AMP receptor protein
MRCKCLNGESVGQVRKKYAAGETISHRSGAAAALFYVEQGKVATTANFPDGTEAVVGLRGPGDFFGLRSLLEGGSHCPSGIALTECTVVQIEKSALVSLLRDQQEFGGIFIDYLLRQHMRDGKKIIYQSYPAEERLRQTLLEIADLKASSKTESLKITQTMLAKLVGTTRPRISVFMNNFRRQGLIEYNRAGMLVVRNALRKVPRQRQ